MENYGNRNQGTKRDKRTYKINERSISRKLIEDGKGLETGLRDNGISFGEINSPLPNPFLIVTALYYQVKKLTSKKRGNK